MKHAVRRNVQIKQPVRFQHAQDLGEDEPEHFRMLEAGGAEHDILGGIGKRQRIGIVEHDIDALAGREIEAEIARHRRAFLADRAVHIERADLGYRQIRPPGDIGLEKQRGSGQGGVVHGAECRVKTYGAARSRARRAKASSSLARLNSERLRSRSKKLMRETDFECVGLRLEGRARHTRRASGHCPSR